MKRKILILGGALFQIPFIKKAKELDLFVGIVDINNSAPGRQYADKFYQGSVKDVERVQQIAREFNPDGVTVGMVDIAIPACSYVTTVLNLPGIDLTTAKKATNKYEMINTFMQNNVPHPKFQYISKEKIGVEKILIDCPLIVKPIDMAGSRGIILVENKRDIVEALKRSSNIGCCGDVLIEEYMDGPEVSVELVIKDGIPHVIQITDKTTSGAPHFAETGHLQPSMLDKGICDQIRDVACRAAKSLGLINSLGHAEIKITKNGPKMVEIGARAGGDAIGEQLLELSTGISFPEIAIKCAMGDAFKVPEYAYNKGSCIRFITTKEGVLSSIEGIDDAKCIAGIKEIEFIGELGKKYEKMIDSSGRLGYVLAQADDARAAKKICDEAYEKIHIQYRNE